MLQRPAFIVYFANWRLHEQPDAPCAEVCELPWARVRYINHAFWKVVPDDPAPRATARTAFHIESICPEADLGHPEPSARCPGAPRGHFAQYARMAARYPDVGVVLSIGGWGNSGFFSEMSYTAEGRSSFVRSCVALLREHPWLRGVDIDWEYPGMARPADGPGPREEGCPVFGARDDDDYAADTRNFTLLMADLRAGLDEAFGAGTRVLTCCCGADTDKILLRQDWPAVARYADCVNIMTYDMAGFDGKTGHHTSVAVTRRAAEHLLARGVPAERLCVGTPYYPHVYRVAEGADPARVGAPAERCGPEARRALAERLGDPSPVGQLARAEALPPENPLGLRAAYDEAAGGAYAFCALPGSPLERLFLSYESERSLEAKLALVREKGLAGLIVWEIGQDDEARGFPRTAFIADRLGIRNAERE